MTMIPFTRINLGAAYASNLNQNPTAPVRFSFAIVSRALVTSIPTTVTASSTTATTTRATTTVYSSNNSCCRTIALLLPAVQSLKKELHLSHEKHVFAAGRKKYLTGRMWSLRRTAGRWQQQADEQMAAAASEMALSQQVQEPCSSSTKRWHE
jgi:hypothetical protein